MADKGLGYPKCSIGDVGKVKHKNKQFIQVASYPDLQGFTDAGKLAKGDAELALEKGGPKAMKGPI